MMSYKSFYRHIVQKGDSYEIQRKGEKYGTYSTLADALYERDRLMAVDWDWDKSMELPETINGYKHIDLPPFNHKVSYISKDKECWVVRNKGKDQRYRGTYYSEEEAIKVARIYNGTISHKKEAYRVQKRIDGRTKYFGRFNTLEEAEQKVKELERRDWNANTTE